MENSNSQQQTGTVAPDTQNPQSAPTQLFPEQANIQPTSPESILDNRQAVISVPSNPLPEASYASEAPRSITGLVIISLIAGVVAIILFYRSAKQSVAVRRAAMEVIPPLATLEETEPEPTPEPAADAAAEATAPETTTKPAKKKPSKSSKSKKKKKRR